MSKKLKKSVTYSRPRSPEISLESPNHREATPSIFENVRGLLRNLSDAKPTSNLKITSTGRLDSMSVKARELKYNLQEWILMKSIVFSLVVFVAFAMLSHFILNLAGGYLPVLILSILTSIALRPTSDHLSSSIKHFFGIIRGPHDQKYFIKQSLIYSAWKLVAETLNYKQSTGSAKKKKQQQQRTMSFFKNISLTGDVYALISICIIYIIISKFGIEIVLYVAGIIIVADFIFKLLLDTLALLINQFSFLRKMKSDIQKNKNFSLSIDSTVATIVLMAFLIIGIGLIIFMGFLLLMDIETIILNLRSSITLLIQNINEKVSIYMGIENAIDENFVISFLKNYNESIYSYIENQDLKGTLNSLNKTTPNNSTFPEFTNITLGENSTEFKQCLTKNRIDFNLNFLRDLEGYYCTLLPYTHKLSIDPFTTIRKIKDGLSFIFQILFGTILVELYLVSKAAMDYFFNFIVFTFCVYYLLHANKSAIYTALSLLPFDKKVQNELHDSLVKSIKGAFLCSIKIFIYHFFLTWLTFDLLKLKLGFTISIAASIFSILPFIPSWSLCIPHAIFLYVGRDTLLGAILFPVCYVLISNKVYNDIYKKSIDVHPYVTGLSIVMGIYAFDVQGIIYGPILMCVAMIVIELIKKYGVSTDTMLKLYKKKIILDQLEALDRAKNGNPDVGVRPRSRSTENALSPRLEG